MRSVRDVFERFKIKKKQDNTEGQAENIEVLDKVLKVGGEYALPEYYELTEVYYKDVKGKILDKYPVYDPWAHIVILEEEDSREIVYKVDEVPLTDLERKIFSRILDYMIWSIGEVPPGTNPIDYISHKARRAIDLFRIRLGSTPTVSWSKILYYIERNILGYDVLDPLMKDPFIEDISCNGVGYPIYVWHRKYESIPTNFWFTSHESLDRFVLKLAHKAGKHISVAFPVLDAVLPEGHRVAATFMKEVSTHGSTFTIRKFKEDPITIVDLIMFRTITPLIAGYLWFLIDRKSPIMVLGVTGAGKTTLINSILNLVKPAYKVVTIEDTPELRLPVENWVQLVSRPSYAAGESKAGEISLFDLVRVSLRYRPDIIVVGEIRGEEAYVLFQAIATGHGGVTTIHAEDIDSMIKRLKSPPMNIPESYIPLINSVLAIRRVSIKERDRIRTVRRVTDVWELDRDGSYRRVFYWSPSRDEIISELDKSILVARYSKLEERTPGDTIDEIISRAAIMLWLSKKGIRNYRDIAKYIAMYHLERDRILNIVERDLKSMEIDLTSLM